MRLIHALAAALVATASPALAQFEGGRPTLTVAGVGKTKAKPDVARLSAVLVTRAPDLQGASDAHGPRAAKAAEALAALKGKGVTVNKSAFTLRNERIDRNGYPQPMQGTERKARETEGIATTRFDLEVRPVDGIDEVVSALAFTGILEVTSVTYALDDPKVERDKARALAMRDARSQARIYAESGEFKLGEIISVNGGSVSINGEEAMAGRAMAMASSVGAPMQAAAPATIDTEATVGVSWRIIGPETRP